MLHLGIFLLAGDIHESLLCDSRELVVCAVKGSVRLEVIVNVDPWYTTMYNLSHDVDMLFEVNFLVVMHKVAPEHRLCINITPAKDKITLRFHMT